MLLPLLALPLIAVQRAGRQALIAERLALHDALTGLPNRVLFRTRTQQRDRGPPGAPTTRVAVMLLDLDRFKEINDTLGHHYGDEVLRQVGERLSGLLREDDTVARLGGDEFAILLRAVETPAAGVGRRRRRAARHRRALRRRRRAPGARRQRRHRLLPRARPGRRRAHAARRRRHVPGQGGPHRASSATSPSSTATASQRLALAGDLRTALEREEFVLHYQPKVDLRTDAVSGAEVLLRWAHPVHGWLPPDEFIPLAEHTGLIVPLTNYVLDHALRQMGAWRAQGLDIGVAVNLSARTLIERELPDRHRGHVPALGRARPNRLVLEITESMVVADPARALPILARLHELGVEISVDDFGTGFSSMDYLKRLPVREVKIDRSFVTTMATDARDAAIVRCTIDLARSLGLRVVAEGVETPDVRARLTTLGCDQAQGYSFSRALPQAEFAAWLTAREHSALALSA